MSRLPLHKIQELWNKYPICNYISEVEGLVRYIDQVESLHAMLEIGVDFGGSLRMWETMLQPGDLLIGIDINPETLSKITGQVSIDRQPADSLGWKLDWAIESSEGNVHKLVSDRDVYVIVGDSTSPRVREQAENLLAGRKFDFIFHDGQHYGPGPVRDYENFQHLLRTDGLLCVADVSDYQNPNCGCQELVRALPEPKVWKTDPPRQGMAVWRKQADFVLDAEAYIKQVGLTDPGGQP